MQAMYTWLGLTLASQVALAVTPASADVALASLLSNSGFEAYQPGEQYPGWLPSRKNSNYQLTAPLIDPLIRPKTRTTTAPPLQAPAGAHFLGVLNAGDANRNGRLVHTPVSGLFPGGTRFVLTAWGNHGRLGTAAQATFPPSRTHRIFPATELTFQFLCWAAGPRPTFSVVDSAERWSRPYRPLKLRQEFTNWAAVNGQWTTQSLAFVLPATISCSYVTLTVTIKNHVADAYGAVDFQ